MLLKASWRKWVGPPTAFVGNVGSSVGFARGFWTYCRVDVAADLQLAADPAWATVERLQLASRDPAPFLAGAPRLRELGVNTLGQLGFLAVADGPGPSLRSIVLDLSGERVLGELILPPRIERFVLRVRVPPDPARLGPLVESIGRVLGGEGSSIRTIEINLLGDQPAALEALLGLRARCRSRALESIVVRWNQVELRFEQGVETLRWTQPIGGRWDLRELGLLITNLRPQIVDVVTGPPSPFDGQLVDLVGRILTRGPAPPPPIELHPAGG